MQKETGMAKATKKKTRSRGASGGNGNGRVRRRKRGAAAPAGRLRFSPNVAARLAEVDPRQCSTVSSEFWAGAAMLVLYALRDRSAITAGSAVSAASIAERTGLAEWVVLDAVRGIQTRRFVVLSHENVKETLLWLGNKSAVEAKADYHKERVQKHQQDVSFFAQLASLMQG